MAQCPLDLFLKGRGGKPKSRCTHTNKHCGRKAAQKEDCVHPRALAKGQAELCADTKSGQQCSFTSHPAVLSRVPAVGACASKWLLALRIGAKASGLSALSPLEPGAATGWHPTFTSASSVPPPACSGELPAAPSATWLTFSPWAGLAVAEDPCIKMRCCTGSFPSP